MASLEVKLKSLENPYSNEKYSEYDLWGQIKISFDDETLTDTQWDIIYFIEWFYNVHKKLANEIFPFKLNNSIAETRDLLYSKEDFSNIEEEIRYYENLENYFNNHHFKLKGTDTLHFYIGLIKSGYGEISYIKNQNYYSHAFVMNNFINRTNEEINRFLHSININNSGLDVFSILKKRIPNSTFVDDSHW